MRDPWTLYWQADRLDSCISSSAADAAEVHAFWAAFAATLTPEAKVLDLATGNGTVPASLLRASDSLNVTGVDRAEISPTTALSDPGVLTAVEFRGNVDVCALPFADAGFDAVTSQFGIEYAPLEDAIAEATRVLRPGGAVCLLMHHADSEIVKPARIKIREMDALLEEGGVLLTLAAYLNGQCSAAELEAAGQAHLASDIAGTAAISGQVFDGVNRVIQSVQKGDEREARALGHTMHVRLSADRERLRMLDAAALDPERFDAVVQLLAQRGVSSTTQGEFRVRDGSDDHCLIGWQLVGRKG